MADMFRVTSVVGARPQFVKLAPVSRAFERHDRIVHSIVHTGQHYDENMSASFFEQLDIPEPDIDLGAGSGSHGKQTAAMLVKLEEHFLTTKPDAVVIYGDTNSTLAASLAASKLHIPVAHVEAGLRSFDRTMPEEVNRIVADHCSDRLYAPTARALANLENENLASRAVQAGDVMLDAVLHNLSRARATSSTLRELGETPGEFGVVTIHRAGNTEQKALASIIDSLREVSSHIPLLMPVHPRTRSALNKLAVGQCGGLRFVQPLPYLDLLVCVEASGLVLTDSGGLQKEAAILGTPCVTLRETTEWTETVEAGVNRLVGRDRAQIVAAAREALATPKQVMDARRDAIRHEYGDGVAAKNIARDLVEWISKTKQSGPRSREIRTAVG